MKRHPKLQSLLTINFIIVALCPVIAIGYMTLHLLTKNLERDAIQQNTLLARSLTAEAKRYLREPRSELGQIAMLIHEGDTLRPDRINAFLDTAVNLYPSIAEIQIVDHAGSIRYASPASGKSNLLEEPFFKAALKSRKPYVWPIIFSSKNRSPCLVMTWPLDRGLVVGYISLEPLNAMLGRVKSEHTGYAAIIDGNGVAVAHSDPVLRGKKVASHLLPRVSGDPAGLKSISHYDFRGRKLLGCIAFIPELGWRLMVMQSQDEVFAPVKGMRNILMGGVLLSVILALVIAFFSRRKIVKPFQRLVSNAGKIAKGDFDIPPAETSYIEIDALSEDFRTMSSALKAREAALQQSEENYRNLVENSFDGIFVQKGTKIIFANQRLCQMLGYDPEELTGAAHWIVYHPEYRDLTRERAAARMRGEAVPRRYEVKLQRKNGSWFFGEVYAKEIQLDGEPGIQVWISDLTERKEAEAAVLKSRKRFEDLFNSITDLIYTQDLEGRFLTVNPAMCALFGYDFDELVGRRASEFMAPELRPLFKTEYIETLKKKGRYEGTSAYRAKEGRKILIEYHSTLVTPDEGEPYISGTGRDVTEKVHSQKQLKALREKVMQSEKLEAIGVLAGGVAHDFNNLLMGIQGNASLMLVTTDKAHSHYDRLKNIETYVQQGADLSRQLLGFARGGKYEIKPTDLNQLLKNELALFSRTRKELAIRTDFQKNSCVVEADRGQMTQVFLNLFINAWQAMPGGGELYVQTRNVDVAASEARLHQVKPGSYVRVLIRDSGVGMDKTTLGRVFEPFFTTKEMGRGTGLGLASVYGTIKNHDGFLHVESEPEKGTSFYLYLPASDKQLRAPKTKPPDMPFVGNGERILLVDDEERILEVGEKMLEALGYTVIAAKNGEAAIEYLRAEKDAIAMVILDMIMPGMGGGETYDHLKEIDRDIKVLLSSGYSIDGEAKKILERGCRGFIQKPFDLEALSRAIRRTLAH